MLYDPHAATDHRVDMLDQLASERLPQVPGGRLKKASVISLSHAKKATDNDSVKHPELLSEMMALQHLIPETKHDDVKSHEPSSKHNVIKMPKKWHDPHGETKFTVVEESPPYIPLMNQKNKTSSSEPVLPPRPWYTQDHDLDQHVPSSKHTKIAFRDTVYAPQSLYMPMPSQRKESILKSVKKGSRIDTLPSMPDEDDFGMYTHTHTYTPTQHQNNSIDSTTRYRKRTFSE